MGRVCMGRVGYVPSLLGAEFVMSRVCHVPSLLCAEFVMCRVFGMCRVVPKSFLRESIEPQIQA